MPKAPDGEFAAFMAVAKQRSFTKAAKVIGVSTPTLSQTISGLEHRLGVRLFNRTTRSVAPTAAGEHLLNRLKPVLAEYEAALDSINGFRDKPAGLLRLTVAPPAAQSVLAPKLPKFLARYPDIRVEVSVDSAEVDIVSTQFDAGIRSGERIDRDMIAVRVSDRLEYLVAGAPSYFERHPKPNAPEDLHAHNCLRIRFPNGALMRWWFRKGNQNHATDFSGSLVVNDVDLLVASALAGVGLVQLPREFLAPHLKSGQLATVLDDHRMLAGSFYIYYPSRRHMPAALRAFVDFFRMDKSARH